VEQCLGASPTHLATTSPSAPERPPKKLDQKKKKKYVNAPQARAHVMSLRGARGQSRANDCSSAKISLICATRGHLKAERGMFPHRLGSWCLVHFVTSLAPRRATTSAKDTSRRRRLFHAGKRSTESGKTAVPPRYWLHTEPRREVHSKTLAVVT